MNEIDTPGNQALQPAYCADCGAPVSGRYCASCGQETLIETPTVRHFVQEFADQYIALEGKLGRTLRTLLTRPGQLTLDYVQGRRQRYVRPLKLYLTISVVFFGLLGLLPDSTTNLFEGVGYNLGDHATADKDDAVKKNTPDAAAPDDLKKDLSEAVGDKIAGTVKDFAGLPVEEQRKRLRERLADDAPYALFFLLPYFALVLKLVYRGRHRLYGEHLLFSLHLHSFAFLVLALGFLPLPAFIRSHLDWLLLIYLFFALRRVYGGMLWGTTWRLGLIYAFYVVALTATAVSGVMATVLGGSPG